MSHKVHVILIYASIVYLPGLGSKEKLSLDAWADSMRGIIWVSYFTISKTLWIEILFFINCIQSKFEIQIALNQELNQWWRVIYVNTYALKITWISDNFIIILIRCVEKTHYQSRTISYTNCSMRLLNIYVYFTTERYAQAKIKWFCIIGLHCQALYLRDHNLVSRGSSKRVNFTNSCTSC